MTQLPEDAQRKGVSTVTAVPVRRWSFADLVKLGMVHGILLIGAIIILTPFVWMFLTSLRDPMDIFSDPFGFSFDRFKGVENYSRALSTVPMLQFMINGLVVVSGILTVQLTTSIACAYALAKLDFPGRPLLFALVVFGLCIPIQVPALPLYLGLAKFNLLDSYFALMFPWFLSTFAIFFFRQFFKSFPDEVIHAARLDGFSELEIVFRLIVPSALPAIAAFSIFSVTAHWNDLYWPLIVVSSLDQMTPPLGMMFFRNAETGTSYGALMAGAVIVTLPLLVLFMFAQRRFVEGITMTGIK